MKIVNILRATVVVAVFFALSTGAWAAGFISGIGCVSSLPSSTSNATLTQFNTDCGANPNTVTFTTDTINFNDTTAAETFGTFLASDVPPVAGAVFHGALTSGSSSNGSIWEFSGTANFTSGSITHDDGFSLYLDGSSVANPASSPGPSNATTAVTGVSGLHSFILIYAESNSSPAVLTASLISPVPEPRQVGFLLFGLLGTAILLRRKCAASQQ